MLSKKEPKLKLWKIPFIHIPKRGREREWERKLVLKRTLKVCLKSDLIKKLVSM